MLYLPITRAEPPSPLRQLAYSEGTDIVGPDGDPEGWKTLPPVKITGTLFDTRQVDVDCALSIANPTTYARGSMIPVVITLTSQDEQALDVLSAPTAIRLYLLRIRTLGPFATDDTVVQRSDKVFYDQIVKAVWWNSREVADMPKPEDRAVDDSGKASLPPTDLELGKRTLNGEIRLNSTLKPSFVFPRFSLRYHLALQPFDSPGFVSSSKGHEYLHQEPVVITTLNAPGVMPRSLAPPGYVPPEGTDYNASVGYLENGNQKFLHHGGIGW